MFESIWDSVSCLLARAESSPGLPRASTRRARQLALLRRDLVARGSDPRDGDLGLVAQLANPVDDVGVLLLDPVEVLNARADR